MSMFSGLTRGDRILISSAIALTLAAAIAQLTGAPGLLRFGLCAAALATVAWVVGFATESIGSRYGPGVTGVLQSTMGNLPEFFVVVFALAAGQTVVAETSIFGSIFANALLVLGIAIIVGAHVAPDGVMRFGQRLPNDTATLMLLAVFIITLLGLSGFANDRASHHQLAISVVGAICLLAVYAAWLFSYLRNDLRRHSRPDQIAHPESAKIAFRPALGLLVVAGVAAALVSEWFISAIDPAVAALHVPKAFVGLIIVAIAGNAVENVVGIQLAAKRKYDLSLSVIKNSIAQITVFLYPLLVLVSLAFDTHLTFAVSSILIGGLALTAIAVWQITGDGDAMAFEGWALVALYVILATLFFFE